MIVLNRILHPADFSECSAQALEYAASLASKFDAELHLLHVCERTASVPLPEYYLKKMQDMAADDLDKLAGADSLLGLNVVNSVGQGTPFVEVIRYAREYDIDLIVMGTHGRGAIAHLLMGSVAEKVVRKAPCAVLTVRPTDFRFEMP